MPRTNEELLADWIPVDQELPKIGKINGFWDDLPVTIATNTGRVCGAFFTFTGGDDMDDEPGITPVPSFKTDEGLGYSGVTHWQYMPKHPKDLK